MNGIDVMKIVRENDENIKKHIAKIKDLEEKEKKLNYFSLYKKFPNLKEREINSTELPPNYLGFHRNDINYQRNDSDSQTSNKNYDTKAEVIKERLNKEKDYKYPHIEEEKNENLHSDENNKIITQSEKEKQDIDKENNDNDDHLQEENFEHAKPHNEEEMAKEADDLNEYNHNMKKVHQGLHNCERNKPVYSYNKPIPMKNCQPYNIDKPKKITPKFHNYSKNISSGKTNIVQSTTQKEITNHSDCINQLPSYNSVERKNKQIDADDNRSDAFFAYNSIKNGKRKSSEYPEVKETPSYSQDKVIPHKKDNHHTDKVALYHLHKIFWEKKPYLKANIAKITTNDAETNPQVKKINKLKMTKIHFVRKPLKYYTKM